MTIFLHLPGYGGSGPAHWQSRWEAADPAILRFAPSAWEAPDLNDWVAALDRAIDAAAEPPVLVAHSLSCLLVPHWQAVSAKPVRGAFLVAPPDPDGAAFPRDALAFAPVPRQPLRFASFVVASTNDPYGSADFARGCARDWGSGFAVAGALGHINSDSGLEDWPDGQRLLQDFVARDL